MCGAQHKRPQRFLITQDLDFSDMRRYTPGTHAGLLLVRLARPGRNALVERVSAVFQTEQVDDWAGCLVVATDQGPRQTTAAVNRTLIRSSEATDACYIVYISL
jgi:hypothetical protein